MNKISFNEVLQAVEGLRGLGYTGLIVDLSSECCEIRLKGFCFLCFDELDKIKSVLSENWRIKTYVDGESDGIAFKAYL